MEGMEAVIDAPEVDVTGGDGTADVGAGAADAGQQGADAGQQQGDDPYSPKSSREYSNWLKGLRDASPENAKFAKLSKDNHSRLYQLNQLEPRGIDGVRETYATIQSVVHGELKGAEALGAIQDELRGVQELDAKLFAGDAEALKSMGPEFIQQALPKLVPSMLDMVREANPDAYASAILPHLVDQLRTSPLVGSFNALVDVLNEQPPSWLPPERKGAWEADKLSKIVQQATAMGQWFNAQEQKAKEVPRGTQSGASTHSAPTVNDERAQFEREKQQHHWRTNIQPGLDRHADKTFNDLFKPYEKRLKLSEAAKADLKAAWVGGKDKGGVIGAAMKNPVYLSQLKRYQGQTNPDANTVLNFAKVEFDKHGKNLFQKLVDTRYGAFLNGRTQQTTPTPTPGARPVDPKVQIVHQKPANIDHKRTPLGWLHQKKYILTDGRVVQWQQ